MALAAEDTRAIKREIYKLKAERTLALESQARERVLEIERKIREKRKQLPVAPIEQKQTTEESVIGKYGADFFAALGYTSDVYLSLCQAGYTIFDIAREWEIEVSDIRAWIDTFINNGDYSAIERATIKASYKNLNVRTGVTTKEVATKIEPHIDEINKMIAEGKKLKEIAQHFSIPYHHFVRARKLLIEQGGALKKECSVATDYDWIAYRFNAGATIEELATELNRSRSTIQIARVKCLELGLLADHVTWRGKARTLAKLASRKGNN